MCAICTGCLGGRLSGDIMDYKEAVDAITAWADGRDRQAYEKAMEEIPDTPAPDKGEIFSKQETIETYAERIVAWYAFPESDELRHILSDFFDEVRGMRLVQDFKQRRIEECAKEIRYWHRMQADMGHAGKNLREILFRYIT